MLSLFVVKDRYFHRVRLYIILIDFLVYQTNHWRTIKILFGLNFKIFQSLSPCRHFLKCV